MAKAKKKAPPVEPEVSLMTACHTGELAAVRALLDRGVDPSIKDPETTLTPLSVAAGAGHAKIVALLLERGADPCPFDGATLVVALLRGHFEIAELLVKKGASVHHGAGGRTAITHVMCYGEPPLEVIDWLLAHGALPEPDRRGNFPLHQAAKEGWSELVSRFLHAGADVDLGPTIDFGLGAPGVDTPLGAAKYYQHKKVVALLEQASAARRPKKPATRAKKAPRKATLDARS